MSGMIYLGGGGTALQEAAVWRAMLRSRPRVLYWPFAMDGAVLAGAEDWLRTSLEAQQPGLDVVTWPSLAGHRQAEVGSFDLLFVGGGNTFDLLAHLHAHDALDWARAFTAAGGDYYGGSAGAILAGQTIAIASWYDEDTTGLQDHSGLALVPGVALLPHYRPAMQHEAQRWSARHGVPVLAVPESAGAAVHHGRLSVLGSDPVWHLTADEVRSLPPGTVAALTGAGPSGHMTFQDAPRPTATAPSR